MTIKIRTIKLLDFDKILSEIAENALSTAAKRNIRDFIPEYNLAEAKRLQNLTEEAMIIRGKYLLSPVIAIDDVGEIIAKNRVGITLNMGELLKIARVLKAAAYLKEKIDSTGEDVVLLKNELANLYVDKKLQKDIEDSIISDEEMSDNASFKLKSIRRNILNLNSRLKEKLSTYTKNNSSSEFLQDNLYTVRNNRFVLPVKSECRSSVPGLIHDQSATGATVFIEPFALVELNNGLQTALAEEQAEIERILADLSKRVNDNLESLIVCKNKITMCDIVFSKAIFGEKTHGIKPFLTNSGITNLIEARHPLIDKNKVVPVSVGVGEGYSVLLITGPNTGGKTVSMKTLGLMCLMAYSGIPLPCKDATVSVYDEIFCDIGDEQSISNELSTFSSHIVNINNIINSVTNKSLVLVDELGGGTDPTEGAALAIGIIKYFETVGCKTIVSTHYDKLKEYALSSKKVMNACMLFDEKTLMPTYKLVIGMPGSSNALKIAEGLGMNAFVLHEAEKNLDSDKIAYENIIRSAEKIKNEAEQEKAAALDLKQQLDLDRRALSVEKQKTDALYEKIKSNATAEVKRIVASKVSQAENIIEEMKQLSEKASEQNLLAARIQRNKLVDLEYKLNDDDKIEYAPLSPDKIKEGARVMIKSLNSEAEILQPPNKKGEVRVKSGNITTFVKASDLGEIPVKHKPEKIKKTLKAPVLPTTPSGIVPEIMVIGQTVSEAIETIEPYLISAHSSPDKELRIVHGKGTMALARGVQNYLKSMPLVKSFRFGRYGEGDNGVTIVTVK